MVGACFEHCSTNMEYGIESSGNTLEYGTTMVQAWLVELLYYSIHLNLFFLLVRCSYQLSYWSSGIGAEDRSIDSLVLRLSVLFIVGFTLHGEGQRTHLIEFQGTFCYIPSKLPSSTCILCACCWRVSVTANITT